MMMLQEEQPVLCAVLLDVDIDPFLSDCWWWGMGMAG